MLVINSFLPRRRYEYRTKAEYRTNAESYLKSHTKYVDDIIKTKAGCSKA